MDNWDDYKFVAALAHFKSMSAAAKHLHTNIATVSRRIHRLTESSGITIFNKDKDGWVLTPTGQELLDVISNFEEGLRRITSSQVSVTAKPVTIRLSTIEYLASSYIAPELGSLASEHPNVSLDFMCSDHTLSLAYGEADIAVRLNRPEEGRLVSRKIADIPYSVFQNPDSSHKAWIGLSEDLDCKVRFLGDLPDNELKKHYQNSDIFILPSMPRAKSVEGFGFVYLEASSNGLPIIAHRIGGVEDAVKDGETGILTNHERPKELKDAMEHLLTNTDLRKKMGQAGRNWAKKHCWETVAKNIYSF